MRRLMLPWLLFVSGSVVGPMLYWLMPPTDWFYYGLGPLLWPLQIWELFIDVSSINDGVAVALNVFLYGIVGLAIAAAAFRRNTFALATVMLELGVMILALWPAFSGKRSLAGDEGTGWLILLSALLFYGVLAALVRISVNRLGAAQ